MKARERRGMGERREADQHRSEGRRIDVERRIWNRRDGARGEVADGRRLDRRGAHPSFFATLGFRLLRGVRRMGSVRRSGAGRRSYMRRCVDR